MRYLTFPVEFIPRLMYDDSVYNHCIEYGVYKVYYEKFITEDGDPEEEMTQALEYLGINVQDVEYMLERGEYFYFKYHNQSKPVPHVSVNKSHIFEFRDEVKTQREKEVFTFYLAIRSILGVKGVQYSVKFNWMLSRWLGKNVPEDLGKNGKNLNKTLKGLYDRYYPTEGVKPSNCKNRRRRDNLLKECCNKWHVHKYSQQKKGFALSIEMAENGLSLEQLIEAIERKKMQPELEKAKVNSIRNKVRARISTDIQELNRTQSNTVDEDQHLPF